MKENQVPARKVNKVNRWIGGVMLMVNNHIAGAQVRLQAKYTEYNR